MLVRSLIALTTLAMAGTALAQDMSPVADFTTDKANDFRGLAYGADGKMLCLRPPRRRREGNRGRGRTVQCRRHAGHQLRRDGFAEIDIAAGKVEQSLGVAPLANGDVVATVNATEDGKGSSSISCASMPPARPRPDGAAMWARSRSSSAGPTPGTTASRASEVPRRTPPGTSRSTIGRRGEADRRRPWLGRRRLRPHRRRPLCRAPARLRRQPRIRTFNGGKPFTYHSAQAFAKAAAASRWRPTARSSAPATPISATRCATTSS